MRVFLCIYWWYVDGFITICGSAVILPDDFNQLSRFDIACPRIQPYSVWHSKRLLFNPRCLVLETSASVKLCIYASAFTKEAKTVFSLPPRWPSRVIMLCRHWMYNYLCARDRRMQSSSFAYFCFRFACRSAAVRGSIQFFSVVIRY